MATSERLWASKTLRGRSSPTPRSFSFAVGPRGDPGDVRATGAAAKRMHDGNHQFACKMRYYLKSLLGTLLKTPREAADLGPKFS